MAASQSGVFSLQEFSDIGAPLVGGRLYTYVYGTTTHKTAYTDKAGSIAHTYTSDGVGGQYIGLNARGELPAPLYLVAGSYDIALKDSTGATIWTRRADPVDDTASALDAAIRADLASTSDSSKGAGMVGFIQSGADAVARTIQDKGREVVSVKDFGAVGDGATDDTDAINAAIQYAITAPITEFQGRTVYFPAGNYAVTEINLSNTVSNFQRSVHLTGEGRWASRIVPFSTGTVLLNMIGRNVATIQGLHFDSSYNSHVPQCAIFMARSTTSGNCNNNKFWDVWITGNYSVASVVCNGSESSYWFGGRIENNYAPASHRCLWTGSGSVVGALQNVTIANGGIVSNTNNPNTDNRMFGVEFYAPFASANPIRFTTSAGYLFDGCSIILGNTSNARFVLYDNPTGSRINGPFQFIGCHLEGFGSGNVIHYFDLPNTGETTIDSLSHIAGTVVVSDGTAWFDFDRTATNKKPTLYGCNLQRVNLPAGVSTFPCYANVLNRTTLQQQKSALAVFDFLTVSTVSVDVFSGNDTQSLGRPYEVAADAVPTSGQWMRGTTITRATPAVGQPIGWKCTTSGTAGTLNGGATIVTVDATATHVVQLNDNTGLFVGCKLNIGGSLRYVREISGTTVYLNSNVTVTAGAAVSFSAPTFVAMANL